MSGRWTVYIDCSLCSAKTGQHSHDEHAKANEAADAEAAEMGFVHLPACGERYRQARFICADCARDISSAVKS